MAPGILNLCMVYDGEMVGWGRESGRGDGWGWDGGLTFFSLRNTVSMLLGDVWGFSIVVEGANADPPSWVMRT